MTYVRYNEDNSIQATATWPAPGMVEVDYEVVRGYDGKLYNADEAPVKPQEQIVEEAFFNLRSERNNRLAETDYMLLPNYPIEKENLDAMKVYRQALRDLPQEKGAPWIDSEIPWPVEPSIFTEAKAKMRPGQNGNEKGSL